MAAEVTINKEKTKMTVVIDMQPPTASASGKTLVVASTRGNQVTNAVYDGKSITLGLNAYFKPQ